ncbi:hypothetical protein GCM10020000_74000 [Streptomyces olivoverticillatus]
MAAWTEKEPVAGFAADISASIRMTSRTSPPSQDVGDDDRGPGGPDPDAGADEQPRSDGAAERDHGEVALFEASREGGAGVGGARWLGPDVGGGWCEHG